MIQIGRQDGGQTSMFVSDLGRAARPQKPPFVNLENGDSNDVYVTGCRENKLPLVALREVK